MLHEQTERSLRDYQNKLLLAERQIDSSNKRLNTLDSNRESSSQEAARLRGEVDALKQTYVNLENEKDKILVRREFSYSPYLIHNFCFSVNFQTQLDTKTEKVFQLEYELKSSKEKRNGLEKQVTELEEQLR